MTLSYRWPRILAAAFLLPFAFAAFAQAPQHFSRVTVDLSHVPGGVGRLLQLGIAADHGAFRKGVSITTDLSGEEQAILQQHNIPFEVLIPDVQAWYVEHADDPAPANARDRSVACAAPADIPVPAHFNLGSMGGYFTWDEMIAELDEMAAAYPNLISVKESIGESWEGRALYMVRISNNPGTDQDKPEVLYDALHHAREPASLSQLIFYMWHLLENYGTDPEITWLVDHTEMYFVPCVNPDGYVYNETMSPDGGGMWRKNRRDNGNGTFGVDLNRNYGHEWGYDDQGSSPNTNSQVYRGPSAFSEPETQAMRDLCNAHAFRLALNYHTYGNLLIYPWGYEYSIYTPDSAVFSTYGLLFTRDNRYLTGTGDQTVGYVTNGDSDDWMYGEQVSKPKILSMTPEAGVNSEGFWPPSSRIHAICKENISQNLRMAHVAYVHGECEDRTPPVLAGLQPHVRFQVRRFGQEQGPITVSITPLDLVLGAGPAITYSDLDLLESRTDSIAITLDPTIQDGEQLRFVLVTDCDGYIFRDTLTKVFGTPGYPVADAGNDMANWTGDWGLTSNTWHSPPSCFTDSPFGNYSGNSEDQLDLASAVDLSGSTSAKLVFWAKWDVEPAYDQVQVLASADGQNWEPLCGLFTHPGGEYQSEDEPLYDGLQPEWVQEHINLADYLGGPLHLRFELRSDAYANGDGFFLDDVQVVTTGADPSAIPEFNGTSLFSCMPNPAQGQVRVRFQLPASSGQATLVVHDAMGALVLEQPLGQPKGEFMMPTSGWAPGVYALSINGTGVTPQVQRLVVLGR